MPGLVPEEKHSGCAAGAAAQIYGKNMARIRGMDQLARAAGRLIQNEIRELGD